MSNILSAREGMPVGFLGLTALAALCFFAASMIAFQTLQLEAFATSSAALAVSTFVGAVMQFGAVYVLPNAAKRGSGARDRAFAHLLFRSATAGAGVVVVALALPLPEFLRYGLLVGAATGVQLVCDHLVRCRAELRFLGGLNATLHGTFLVLVFAASVSGTLTASGFLTMVFWVKAGFALAVLVRFGLPETDNSGVPRSEAGSLTGAQTAAALICLLGTVDVLLIEAWDMNGAEYIALRHFGYGLFLLVVQESAMPLLVARLVMKGAFPVRQLTLFAVALSTAVGTVSIVLSLLLAIMRGVDIAGPGLGGALFFSLFSHSLAVIFQFAALACGVWGTRQLLLFGGGIVGLWTLAAVLPPDRTLSVIIAAALLNLLVACCALQDYARIHPKRKTEKC
jgi:hypothetical protein